MAELEAEVFAERDAPPNAETVKWLSEAKHQHKECDPTALGGFRDSQVRFSGDTMVRLSAAPCTKARAQSPAKQQRRVQWNALELCCATCSPRPRM